VLRSWWLQKTQEFKPGHTFKEGTLRVCVCVHIYIYNRSNSERKGICVGRSFSDPAGSWHMNRARVLWRIWAIGCSGTLIGGRI